jgi:hypothetical protein
MAVTFSVPAIVLRLLLATAVVMVASFLIVEATAAQTAPTAPTNSGGSRQTAAATGRVRVFLDCGDCFSTYLREEIEWVDFVRQPQDADVQVLSSANRTGGGGEEVVLRFIGLGRFQGIDTELKAISQSGDTEDMQRQRILRTVTVALLSYVERAGRSGDVKLDVEPVKQGAGQTTVADDPWRAWVFTLRGGGSFDFQESNREWNWDARATADRVTELWRASFGFSSSTQHEQFDLDEEDPFKVVRRDRTFNGFLARGLGAHWSAGVEGSLRSSTFGNTRFSASASPAIEFNVFPYADYASRQLRLQYQIGAERARYNEVTLFDKLKETLGVQAASLTLELVQPWGEMQVGAEFSQYLHDFGKYRFEVGGELSFRISRALSLSLDGSASRIRNQISLPRRGATPEEVLLRLRELQSGYRIDFSANLTYRFGSIFNNIVNPRFGR